MDCHPFSYRQFSHSRRRSPARLLHLAVAALSLQVTHHALATSTNYTGPDAGNWATALNWTTSTSTHVVPVNGDDVALGNLSTVSSVTFNGTNLTGSGLNSLTLNSPGHSSITLNQTGAFNMIAVTENIGTTVTANSYVQSAGTNSAANITLGVGSGSSGAYTLSGTGSVTATSNIISGNGGGGTFTQSAGTLAASNMIIGSLATGVGSYNLNGGTSNVTNFLTVGSFGTGFFTQTAGTMTAAQMDLGSQTAASGTYAISGTANATYIVLIAGDLGVGTVNQSGGNITLSNNGGIIVGNQNATVSSLYSMTGGSLKLNGNAILFVGDFGIGSMAQSAGTITFGGGAFGLGENTNAANGNYTLSGTGVITGAGREDIGGAGIGVFTQNGGNNTLASAGNLTLGFAAAANGTYLLNGGNLSLNSGTENIGLSGNGTFIQTGGSNFMNLSGAAGTGFFVAENPGANGFYSLQNGTLTTTFANEIIGDSGNGTFTQSGGANSIGTASPSALLILANSGGSNGNYALSGSALLSSAGAEIIGGDGNGTFTQTGGTNAANNPTFSLFLGYNPGSTGIYNLQGGNLTLAGGEIIGDGGNGTFTQSGGNHSIAGTLFLGNEGNANYTLSGSAILTAAGGEIIGEVLTTSSFTQSGGTNNTPFLEIAEDGLDLSFATYTLTSGTLNVTAGNETVGVDGTAIFHQSGGLNNVTGQLIVGSGAEGNPGETNLYTLSGGTLAVAGNELIGPGTFAIFVQSGGTNNAQGPVGLSIGGGAFTASYTLAGGTLVTNALVDFGIPSAFTWTGGTLDLTAAVTFDPAANPATTAASFGSSLTLSIGSVGNGTFNSPMFLIVNGNETIGGGGAFKLTVNAGTSDSAAAITVAPTGTLFQNGGSITSTLVTNNGTFLYSGGAFNGQLSNFGSATFNASGTLSSGLTNAGIVAPIALGTTLTLNGAGLANTGSITLAGGGITATAATNAGFIIGYGTLQAPSFTNSGVITQTTGSLLINSLTVGFDNIGTVNLAAGLQLTLLGAAATNDGFIGLNGGTINIGPSLTNAFDGTINGPGKIIGLFTNNGTLALPTGSLNLPSGFVSSGLITLSSPAALLTGGTITTSGSLQGAGTVAAPITNNGTIEALGGTLTFTAAVTNTAGGIIRSTTGTKVLMQNAASFPANAGLIDLAGGTFDNGGRPFTNSGAIDGYGVLAASTLTNSGAILFTGGTATINANIVNSPGDRIDIKFQPAFFTGNITNNGIIKTWSTTVTYTGTLNNLAGSSYTSDPATNIFQNNINNAGTMTGGTGDVYIFTSGAVTNSGTFTNGGTLQTSDNITNSGHFTQSGPQSWSATAGFTNTAGAASFQSNAKLANLTITGGTVDLTNRQFIIEPPNKSATLAALQSDLAAHTLISSALAPHLALALIDNAALTTPFTTFGGMPADAGSLLIAPELLGDANIDGHVDLTDLNTVLNNLGTGQSSWNKGNFDGAAAIDLTDLNDVLNNLGLTFAGANTAAPAIAVPEPASLSFLLTLLPALLKRRLRRSDAQ